MRQFVSHRVVRAAQIIGIQFGEPLLLMLDDKQTLKHPGTTKYQPIVGDYYIVYEDGYKSLCPQASFEKGYTEVKGD